MEHSCIPQYHADNIYNQRDRSRGIDSLIYIGIGNENCEIQNSPPLCNGPLKPGTKYALTMRFYTESGYADSEYITIITDKEIPLLTIILSLLIVMVIVFTIGFYITYKKTRYFASTHSTNNINCLSSSHHRKSHSAGHFDRKDVPIQNYEAHHKEMISNDNEKIREEFNAIQFYSSSLDKTMVASKANEKCNRYANISPFDYNRVVLNEDEYEHEYINASFVNVSKT
jgi:protein-tyrosine phosphatase